MCRALEFVNQYKISDIPVMSFILQQNVTCGRGGGYSCPSNCTLVADLFLFSYDRDFMLSFSDNNQADVVEAFNSTSRYLDALLNIDNPYFAQMVSQIYPTELQLNKANPSE